jgi:predicted RNA methylase
MQLSKLERISVQNLNLEQYQTEGELAARWLFDISSFNDIFDGCRVVDLGSGNGILGLGSILIGAESATLVEVDEESCKVCRKNVEALGLNGRANVVNFRIGEKEGNFQEADLVISNPPWGKQSEAADRPFLETIISIGSVAHIMHSAEATHIKNFFDQFGWSSEKYGECDFALPATYVHHTSKRGRTRASFWRISPP